MLFRVNNLAFTITYNIIKLINSASEVVKISNKK
jgi:hypothetical protein